MAATWIKSVGAAFLAATAAANGAAPLPEGPGPAVNTTTLAQARFAKAVAALEARTTTCNKQRTVLKADLFEGIPASTDQLRVALGYFAIRADNLCVEREADRLVTAAHLLELESIETGGTQPWAATAVLESQRTELEWAVEYLALAPETRRQLEAVSALERPFDMLGTARALGLY